MFYFARATPYLAWMLITRSRSECTKEQKGHPVLESGHPGESKAGINTCSVPLTQQKQQTRKTKTMQDKKEKKAKKAKKEIKVQDLKPQKDAKGGGYHGFHGFH
jgi:hypothetical protein